MRIRTIKPDFWQSETVGALSRNARLLMIGMLNRSDDDGRFRAHPAQIRGELFCFDEDVSIADVASWLGEIEQAGVIQLYEVDGTRYGCFPKFGEHQKIDKRRKSDLPEPNATLVADPKPNKGCSAPAVSDHGETVGVGMEGNGKGMEGKGMEVPDPSGSGDPPADELFDQWWAVYPKKVGKQAAHRAWKKLRPGPRTLAPRLIAAARAFAAAVRNPQFVPNPATWLNEGRWDDDLKDSAACKFSGKGATGASHSTALVRHNTDVEFGDPRCNCATCKHHRSEGAA